MDSSLDILMFCMGHYESKHHVHKKFTKKKKKCIRTNHMLENGLIHLYLSSSNLRDKYLH